ncbi:DUF4376 domain-containing protein [Phenylobacterium sp. 58.2.17]|uniref:DUF4376 domain-containing protein n=1 Tax=Phenylobacterium sp. 58.2.17 TaxID=2969306 RepID=UPI0022641C0E|nr:DUF4376 domain-containing protein [Phenylobacterium sp. 58.2.17]MCX7586532.1 DUF4376 domain-containing protein [Phenylobacterium sp. 58.2.17]
MTRKALLTELGPVEIETAEPHTTFIANGIRHPLSVLQRWTAAELAEIGVFDIHEQSAPTDHRVVGRSLEMVENLVVETLELEPIPLAELKAEKLAALRNRRWVAEAGGVTVGGVTVASDEKGQGKIAGAIQLFEKDPTLEAIDWEAQPGAWITINAATAIATGIAVGRHVQACFTQARALNAEIDAAENAEQLASINIEEGWPTTAA